MKRKNICSLALTLLMLLSCLCAAYADTGSVTYDGDAQSFVFLPGSDYSPSDLFPDFKGVMPGDRLTQTLLCETTAAIGCGCTCALWGPSPVPRNFSLR